MLIISNCKYKSPTETTARTGTNPNSAVDTPGVQHVITPKDTVPIKGQQPLPVEQKKSDLKPEQKKGEVHVPKGVPEVDEERMKQKRERDKKLKEGGGGLQ